MEWVKHGFATIILAFALWHGWLGATLALAHSESNRRAVAEAQQKHATEGGWTTSLDQALAMATREKKPLFVDCWASWCKNCLRMEKNTFRDPNVTRRLEPYVRLKFRAEKMDDPEVKPVLDRLEVLGLPTYVVLQPLTAKAGHGIE
jgi:thiol:disulfide interchange protein